MGIKLFFIDIFEFRALFSKDSFLNLRFCVSDLRLRYSIFIILLPYSSFVLYNIFLSNTTRFDKFWSMSSILFVEKS